MDRRLWVRKAKPSFYLDVAKLAINQVTMSPQAVTLILSRSILQSLPGGGSLIDWR
jgi:hypothetical protein